VLGEVDVPEVFLIAEEGEPVSVVPRMAPARASSIRAWPRRSSAMLAIAVSSSSSGIRVTCCCSRWL